MDIDEEIGTILGKAVENGYTITHGELVARHAIKTLISKTIDEIIPKPDENGCWSPPKQLIEEIKANKEKLL